MAGQFDGMDGWQAGNTWSGWMDTSTTTEPSWFDNIIGMFSGSSGTSNNTSIWNNQNLWGGVTGAIGAGLNYYSQEKNRDQSQKQNDRNYELGLLGLQQQAEAMAMQAAAAEEANAIRRAELDDRINTRRRHNETINSGPKATPQSIKMR